MKVSGSVKPTGFIVEEMPDKVGYSLARFYENIEEKKDDNGNISYTYDEYQLPVMTEENLKEKIKSNYSFYLLAGKGRDSWEQMRKMLENNVSSTES